MNFELTLKKCVDKNRIIYKDYTHDVDSMRLRYVFFFNFTLVNLNKNETANFITTYQ